MPYDTSPDQDSIPDQLATDTILFEANRILFETDSILLGSLCLCSVYILYSPFIFERNKWLFFSFFLSSLYFIRTLYYAQQPTDDVVGNCSYPFIVVDGKFPPGIIPGIGDDLLPTPDSCLGLKNESDICQAEIIAWNEFKAKERLTQTFFPYEKIKKSQGQFGDKLSALARTSWKELDSNQSEILDRHVKIFHALSDQIEILKVTAQTKQSISKNAGNIFNAYRIKHQKGKSVARRTFLAHLLNPKTRKRIGFSFLYVSPEKASQEKPIQFNRSSFGHIFDAWASHNRGLITVERAIQKYPSIFQNKNLFIEYEELQLAPPDETKKLPPKFEELVLSSYEVDLDDVFCSAVS